MLMVSATSKRTQVAKMSFEQRTSLEEACADGTKVLTTIPRMPVEVDLGHVYRENGTKSGSDEAIYKYFRLREDGKVATGLFHDSLYSKNERIIQPEFVAWTMYLNVTLRNTGERIRDALTGWSLLEGKKSWYSYQSKVASAIESLENALTLTGSES